jgi:sigma-B regulation protein RsbU (phosphoserine phosphatase)
VIPKILIVDDMRLNVELLDHVLRMEGFSTCSASDGATAVAMSRADRPDLILLDIVMPGESGFETCARLKSDATTADIPVIFLSALDDAENKVRGLMIGGADYISKPVDGQELLARVRVHLRIAANNRAIVREQQARLEELRNAQQAILVRPEDYPEASFAVVYKPLEATGGDFYDVVAVDSERFGYFVADISGHGPSAAFLTAAVKALLRQYTGPLYSPADTMRGVDAVMRQMLGPEQYLTACYAHLNRRSRKLSVVSAGHPPMIVVSATGETRILEMDSSPLGMFSAVVLQHCEIPVKAGDRFFLYTDGVTETRPGTGRAEGLERLIRACVKHRRKNLGASVAEIARDTGAARSVAGDDWLLLGAEVPC